MRRVAFRAAFAVLVFGLGLLLVAPYLPEAKTHASAPVPSAEPIPHAATPMTEAELTAWLGEDWGMLALTWLPRLLAALLGVVFLVQMILRAEKVRHGLLPPLPGALGPTVVASPGQALALGLLWPLGVMLVSGVFIAFRTLSAAQLLNYGLATAVAAFLPPAFLTCLRRLRLGQGRIPGAARGLSAGLQFLCIALLVVTPVQIAWALALTARGVPLEVQDIVQTFARPSDPAQPWVLTFFGVVVAPFTEEAVFRGLLYPAVRARMPGGPFSAAIVISLLFAGIHGSLLAAVPLFALALVLTWVMERTNSLLACVVVHALHNALALLPMLMRHLQGPAS